MVLKKSQRCPKGLYHDDQHKIKILYYNQCTTHGSTCGSVLMSQDVLVHPLPPLSINICGQIFYPTSPQPCVATIDATGDLTWGKNSLKSKASLKPTSSSSPLLPPGVLVAQADRDCAKRKNLSPLNCTVLRWSPVVHLRRPHLQRMEEPSTMQITGTDTQGSSWTRPPERRLEDRPNESLIGEGSATWRRSLIWM